MVFDLFNFTLSTIAQHGYLFLFLLMFAEGTVVTYIAAFAASLDVFNIWIIIILALLGNILPDLLFYSIGRSSRHILTSKFFKFFKLKQSRIIGLERMLEKHFVKAFIVIKLTPVLPLPGLIIAGFIRVKFSKVLKYSLLVTIPYTLFFLLLGYYSGISYMALSKFLHNMNMGIIFLGVIVGVTWWAYRIIVRKLLRDMG